MARASGRRWTVVARAAVLGALVAVVAVGTPPPGPGAALLGASVAGRGAAEDPSPRVPAAGDEVARGDGTSRDDGARRTPPPPREAGTDDAAAAGADPADPSTGADVAPPAAEPAPDPAPADPVAPPPPPAPRPPPSGSPPVDVGVPAGVPLAPRGGGQIDLAGGVLENVVIGGDVTVTGSGTLRNVRVEGHLVIRGGDGVQLHASEVAALSISGARNVLVSGVEVYGLAGSDGVHITSGTGQAAAVHLRDVWIHDPQVTGGSHYDGIQVRGVHGLTLERVTIELGPWVKQHNAALFLEDANGGNVGVSVLDSWLGGGGYTFYSDAHDVVVEDTVFAGGRWGHLYPKSWTAEIIRFAGNTDAKGNPLALHADSIG